MFKVFRFIPLFLILFVAIFLISQKNLKKSEAQTAPVCGQAPSDVVVVIDRSASMTDLSGTSGTKLSNAKSSAKRFIDILSNNSTNRAGLSSFSTEGTIDAPVSNNWASIKTEITNLNSSGDTCTECGIFKGNSNLHQNGRAGNKNIMILLTDGRANVIQGSPNKVSETVAENAAIKEAKTSHKNDGTIIFTIGLGTNVNSSFLKEIASVTGGKYYASPTTSQLNNIYDQISQIIAKGSISGIVFNDENGNATLDESESGIPGWNVMLIGPNSNNSNQSTNENGAYYFGGLCDGNYSVKQSVVSSYEQTFPANNTYYTLAISEGNSIIDTNFGNKSVSTPPPPSCVEALPTLSVDPESASGGINETKTFKVTITNNDSAQCLASSISPSASTDDSSWDFNFENTNFIFNPGQSKTFDLLITPSLGGIDGPNTITVSAQKPNSPLVSKNITFNLDNPIPTPIPESPIPQPSGTPGLTKLNLKIGIDGIGTTTRTPIGGNQNPDHANRNLTIRMYNASNNTPADLFQNHTLTYNSQSKKFEGTLNFGDNFQSGIYNVYVEGPQVLRGQLAGSVILTRGMNKTAQTLDMITGDINKLDRSNNNIDLNDYNILISCSIYSQDRSACDLNPNYQRYADLDDNGIVDEDDFTLWLKEIANQGGSQLPQ